MAEFNHILIKQIVLRWALFAVLLLLLWSMIAGSSKKSKKKQNKKASDDVTMCVIALILVFVISIYKTVPCFIDISRGSYSSVHGELVLRSTNSYAQILVEADDGTHISLYVPFRANLNLPYEECEGTVWYAERSEYIVGYIPDE